MSRSSRKDESIQARAKRLGFSVAYMKQARADTGPFGENATRYLVKYLSQRLGFEPNVDGVPPLFHRGGKVR